MRAAAFLAIALLTAAGAGARGETRVVGLDEPKPFGFFIGDIVKRKAMIAVDPGFTLVRASLPQPGQLEYWLWLREIEARNVRRGGQNYVELSAEYQTFYAPLEPHRLVVPSFKARFENAAGEAATATIPSFTFISSPLREIVVRKEDADRSGGSDLPQLMPDRTPELRSTAGDRTGMLISGLGGLLFIVLLARHFAVWPFHARPKRPFTRAARHISRLLGRGNEQSAQRLRDAFLELHRAFDDAAGKRLLATDLDGFVAEHPAFAGERGRIEEFFTASRAAFFGVNDRKAREDMPVDRVLEFAGQLAAIERRQP